MTIQLLDAISSLRAPKGRSNPEHSLNKTSYWIASALTRFAKTGLWGIFFFTSLAFATLKMEVEPHQVGLGDTLTLTLTSDSGQMQAQPDLRPLEKDFSIITTEHRVNYSLINGVTKTQNEWSFTLLPKQAGSFVIPSLQVGKEVAKAPIKIEVTRTTPTPPPTSTPTTSTQNEDVFIRVLASPQTAYINEQVRYTVQVYNRRRLLDVAYTPPKAQGSIMATLNQSLQNEAIIKGVPYAVETLNYVIFPNQSGKLTIHPPELRGLIYDMMPQPIHVRGKLIEIEVKAAPNHAPHFLPAKNISLTETFEPKDTHLSTGTTLIRTITIKGDGVLASLLPSLSLKGKGYTLYPTKPEEKDIQTDNGIIGIATTKVTYLFNDAGTWTLPGIDIPWFNTKTQQFETAHLPAHTFTVSGGTQTMPSVSLPPSPLPTTPTVYWPYWVIGLLIAIIFVLCIGMYKNRAARASKQSVPHTRPDSEKKAKKAVQTACENNDAHQAELALLQWAKIRWPEAGAVPLHEIKKRCKHKALEQAIDELVQTLYSNARKTWSGQNLWKAFEAFCHDARAEKKGRETGQLPDLNPKL